MVRGPLGLAPENSDRGQSKDGRADDRTDNLTGLMVKDSSSLYIFFSLFKHN